LQVGGGRVGQVGARMTEEQPSTGNDDPGLRVEFAGEQFTAVPGREFLIGREGDLALDDNPYLHRSFLRLDHRGGLWWLDNVGSRISATISDPDGRMQAWLAPDAGLPVIFARTTVIFTAGPTTYEIFLILGEPQFTTAPAPVPVAQGLTLGDVTFTPDQLLMIIALAEPALRRAGWGKADLPSNQEAAQRLGWATSRFNRKLDNVCQKLSKVGVKGLHGGPGRLATERRIRLVEYALAARWVTTRHLSLLDPEPPATR